MTRLVLGFGWIAGVIAAVTLVVPVRTLAHADEPPAATADPDSAGEDSADDVHDPELGKRLDRLLREIDEGPSEEKAEALWGLSILIEGTDKIDALDEIVPRLEAMLKNSDNESRVAAAAVLWRLRRDPDAVLPALQRSLNEIEQVAGYLDDDDFWTDRTLWTLRDLGPAAAPAVPRLIELFRASHPDGKWKVARTIGAIGPKAKDAIPTLVQSLGDRAETTPLFHGWTLTTGWIASEALRAIGKDALPAVAPLLHHDNVELRSNALRVIAGGGEAARQYLPTVIEAASDPEAKIRETAVEVMGDLRIAPEKTLPVLVEKLRDGEVEVRVRAADSIGKYGSAGKPAVDALIRALDDHSGKVSVHSAYALGHIGPEARDALPKLRKLKAEGAGGYFAGGILQSVSRAAGGAIEKIETAADERDSSD